MASLLVLGVATSRLAHFRVPIPPLPLRHRLRGRRKPLDKRPPRGARGDAHERLRARHLLAGAHVYSAQARSSGGETLAPLGRHGAQEADQRKNEPALGGLELVAQPVRGRFARF